MAFNYPGNPAGAAGTIPAPAQKTIPTGTGIPSDGDAANAASVNPPGFETAMDWLAFLNVGGALGDALGGGATSFDGSANPTTWNDMLGLDGSPISGLDVAPTYAAGSGFDSDVGQGSGYLFTATGITAGESKYRTIFWNGQNVTHATPDPTDDRIDAITVTPAAFGTASTVAVVTGTPGATVLPPAVPSGSGALFYVYIPAAAADATHFRACRGLWRRVGYPWSGMSAIIAGAELTWDYTADPSAASAQIWCGAADLASGFTVNRLLIDGEPIEWAGFAVGGAGVVVDSANNPFGSAASSNFDRPYYIYAVGGRHNPIPSFVSGSSVLNPVTIVESTVPPNPRTGKPTANMTVLGVTVLPVGAVYLGLGFVVAGSQFRRACLMDGEMTTTLLPIQQIIHAFTTGGREDAGTFTGGCQPVISTKMRISLCGTTAAGIDTEYELFIANHPDPSTPFVPFGAGFITQAAGGGGSVPTAFEYLDVVFTARQGAELWVKSEPATGTAYGVLTIGARGFNHRVNRLVAGY